MLSRFRGLFPTIRRGLYWMIEFIDTLFTQYSDLRATQRYRHSTHFPVHHYTRTRVLSLRVVTWQRIFKSLTVNFKSHMKSSCHSLILFLPFLQLSIQFQAHHPASWLLQLDSILDWTPTTTVLFCQTLPYNHFAWTSKKTQDSLVKEV
jgi:hypothetical protein